MKYHCGKPLQLTLEKGPGKHLPLIEYFERNKDYIADFDYLLISQQQYLTLLDEDFVFFSSGEEPPSSSVNTPFVKVGKIKNLDVFATWMYPQDNIKQNEFDVIIGKRDWIDADLIEAYSGETELEGVKTGYMNKYLMKMSFPVKRGFLRINATYPDGI